MRDATVLRWVERWNRDVHGGWLTLHAAPPFGHGRWVVQVQLVGNVQRDPDITIASDSSLRAALRSAEAWLRERADVDGLFDVAHYLTTDEYARWVAHLRPHASGRTVPES